MTTNDFRVSISCLVPTQALRELNNERLNFWISEIIKGNQIASIRCIEHNGYFYILDGHHRWAALHITACATECTVSLLSCATLKSAYGMTVRQIAQQSQYINPFDWEEVVKCPINFRGQIHEKDKRRFCVLAGPSGAGKTSLIRRLLDSSADYQFTTSTTSRAKRPTEIADFHYFFKSKDEFENDIAKGVFAEWQYVHGHYYGSLLKDILNSEGKVKITDLDIFGALLLKAIYPDQVLLIFVEASSVKVLKERIVLRDGVSDDFFRRLSRIGIERRFASLFDAHVINDDIDLATDDLSNIIAQDQERGNSYSENQFVEYRIFYRDSILQWANTKVPINPRLRFNNSINVNSASKFLNSILYSQVVNDYGGTQKAILLAQEIFSLSERMEARKEVGGFRKDIKLINDFDDIIENGRIFRLDGCSL